VAQPTLAITWASSCGGCDVALLDLEGELLQLTEQYEIVYWPCVLDQKRSDLEALPDRGIDLCLFNGAIRTSDDEAMAHLLRAKARILVAFGSCAQEGCVPGLANLSTRKEIFEESYIHAASTLNEGPVFPVPRSTVGGTEVELPRFFESLRTLDQVVPVNATIPGCPPEHETITRALEHLRTRAPEKEGAVLGNGASTCCEECPRHRREKTLRRFHRIHELIPDQEECLLDQGILCMGPATRSGCGALCVKAHVPCRGCYGPPEGVSDQGAKMMSALGSVIDARDEEEAERIVGQIDDPVGTLYRFSLAHALLQRAHP
jgi:F420-non-reducing hydrogenase small subunit